ncbi:uncharacterized protein G2W53_011873 [Senna tora]|uniref:Uncharacterized protein n=1 Tax=Senna tora TaxID=362788 RepID=A0A834U0R2_9FABA|nr:uncharacterized protein G2W53_011873 [Senna tora]
MAYRPHNGQWLYKNGLGELALQPIQRSA